MPEVQLISVDNVVAKIVDTSSLEPCAAATGNVVFCTYGAAISMSTNAGKYFPQSQNWSSSVLLGPPPCVDMSTIWIPQIKRLVWVMLAEGAPDRLRLCVSSIPALTSSSARSWQVGEITPSTLGLGTDRMGTPLGFDYPQLAVGKNFLYITVRISHPKDADHTDLYSYAAAILRIGLEALGSDAQNVGFQYFTRLDVTSFCSAQDSGETAYWAGWAPSGGRLRVYRCDENSSTISWYDVPVPPFSTDTQSYLSSTPDGKNWLDHLDNRITGGCFLRQGFDKDTGDVKNLDDYLAFAWTAGRSGKWLEPYITIIELFFRPAYDAFGLVGLCNITEPIQPLLFLPYSPTDISLR